MRQSFVLQRSTLRSALANMGSMQDEFAAISAAANEVLQEHCDFIYLLGSAASGRMHSESDVDIAIHSALESNQRARLALTLEERYGRDVDLVELRAVDPVFARQVLETGRLIYCRSPEALLRWQMKQLSMYPDFKFSRRGIEEALLTRKKYV